MTRSGTWRLALVLLVLGGGQRAGADPIPVLTAGAWHAYPASTLRAAFGPKTFIGGLGSEVLGGNADALGAIIGAWSGGAYDGTRHRLIVNGGGHGDGFDARIFGFDLTSGRWTVLSTQTAARPSKEVTKQNHETNPDGTPAAVHSYAGLLYLPPPHDALLRVGGVTWGPGWGSSTVWRYRFPDSTWRQDPYADRTLLGSTSMVLGWDGAAGKVIAHTASRLHAFTPGQAWGQPLSAQGAGLSLRAFGCFDSRRRQVWLFEPSKDIARVKRFWADRGGQSGHDQDLERVTGDPLPSTHYPACDYHPGLDRIFVWGGGRAISAIDPATLVANTLQLTGADPGPPNPTGTYGRFRVTRDGTVVLVNSADAAVHLAVPPGVAPSPGPAAATASPPPAAPAAGAAPPLPAPSPAPASAPAPPTPPAASTTTHRSLPATGPMSAPPESAVRLPLRTAVALAMPPRGKGIPGAHKHVTYARHPASGRWYATGGDYGGADAWGDSYRQETWSLDLGERLAAWGNPAAGWRLEHPYCGPAGQVQPKHPDHVGWVWVDDLARFVMVPGLMYIASQANCPGETAESKSDAGFVRNDVMDFDPVTRRWTAWGIGAGPDRADATWSSVYDPVRRRIIRPSYHGGLGAILNVLDVAARRWLPRVALGQNALGKDVRINTEQTTVDVPGRAYYAVDGVHGRLHRISLDTYRIEDLGPVPDGPIGRENFAMVAWASGPSRLLYYSVTKRFPDTGGLHTYDPATRQWEALPMLTEPAGLTVRARALFYDPALDVAVLLGGIEPQNPWMFLYRFGAAPATSD